MSYKVKLHVYDLSGGMAKQHSRQLMQRQIDGVWSTGIQVYGKEYYFGSGICYDLPGHTPFGQPNKIIDLGETEIGEEDFTYFLGDIKDEFTVKTFNVVQNNYNNFTDRVATILLGVGIPKDIIDQSKTLFNNQVGQQMGNFLYQAQNSLIQVSNPLFTENEQKYPLKIKQHGDNQQDQLQQPGMDPNMRALMDQFGNIGGMGGNQAQQQSQPPQSLQRVASYQKPILGEVVQIQNQAHLTKIIKDYEGVIVDFWQEGCQPCSRFKPIYEGAAHGNKNKKVVFCSVDCVRVRDAAEANVIRSVPTFIFFHNQKEIQKILGADEIKFRTYLNELHNLTMSKAGNHFSMTFKQFKPMNRLPTGFTAIGQIDKMKEFIQKLVITSKGKVNHLQTWLQSFDTKKMNRETIDQLVSLAENAEEKSKIALVDLLRLVVLEENQAEYIFGHHWNLIDTCVIEFIQSQDLKDKEARTIHNYHLACFKFLTNAYQTNAGRKHLQDQAKGLQLVQFCTRSLFSCNQKTIYHAAICLFNHLLCYEGESKSFFNQDLEQALKAVDEILSEKDLTDAEVVMAVLLCECRILYMNVDICGWVEEQFKVYFAETHSELRKRFQQLENVQGAISDVLSMVDIQGRKQSQ